MHATAPYPFESRHHPARLPPLQAGHDPQRHAVVVVGGGPVGWCTAIGLATQGVRVVLLEADDSVCVGSRAICISRRSLQIIQRLGALPGFLKTGLPWEGGRSFWRQQEVLHFRMPTDDNQKLPPMVNLAQYSIEQILLDRAEELADLIDVRWQTRLTRLQPGADGATLQVSTPQGDYALHADWVVACDGGRSFVREALGLKLNGTTYEGRYVIVDILMDSARPTERLAYFDPPCNPGSTVLVHKQPNGVWRIDYQLREGEDPDEAIAHANVAPRVQSLLDMMGERAPWRLIWTGLYKANALTLDRYRHGRVLLAGDAAHLVPIFGVRGANSGIDDADNLAWKLALVVKGLAGDTLLDSYSQERVAAAHENLRHGTKSTEFMAPPSFAFDLMRVAALSLAARHPEVRSLINPRQTTAITYSHSPLNAADDSGFTAGPVPGQVLAEAPVTVCEGDTRQEAFLTDLIGTHFTALHFSDAGRVPAALQDWVQQEQARGLPLRLLPLTRQACASSASSASGASRAAWDHTGRLFPLYGAEDHTLVLLRPDGHVLGRWKQADGLAAAAALQHALQT
jgi:3-(3-hydroxy-phenyl)propionate hydroxylase